MFHFQVLLALFICFELLSLFSYRILVNNHLLKIIFWTAFQYVLFVFFSFHASSLRNHPNTTCAVGGGYEDFFLLDRIQNLAGKVLLTNIWIQSSNPPHVSVFKTKLDPPTDTQFFAQSLLKLYYWNRTRVCMCGRGSGVLKTDTRWGGVREKRARGFRTIPTLCSFPRLKKFTMWNYSFHPKLKMSNCNLIYEKLLLCLRPDLS